MVVRLVSDGQPHSSKAKPRFSGAFFVAATGNSVRADRSRQRSSLPIAPLSRLRAASQLEGHLLRNDPLAIVNAVHVCVISGNADLNGKPAQRSL